MALLRRFRFRLQSRKKKKDNKVISRLSPPAPPGRDLVALLPPKVIDNIIRFVCPHSSDTSYEPIECSLLGEGCMLCDLRDLARCCLVRKDWQKIASEALYKNIRIDAVHYCGHEEVLSEKRNRRSKYDYDSSQSDYPAIRLQLLSRTLRENAKLAAMVQILKIPYMTRESSKSDLARFVSVAPNLRYVDLPDGVFNGDGSCSTLRHELYSRCQNIRKMKYRRGSESFFERLQHLNWPLMEDVEIDGLRVELTNIRKTLATLTRIKHVVFANLPWLNDQIFCDTGPLPDFPALVHLTLRHTSQVSADGLVNYLKRPNVTKSLRSLTLEDTCITVSNLHKILSAADCLTYLSLTETVNYSLTLEPPPPLKSNSLRTLHFEIIPSSNFVSAQNPSESHYAYLTSSLMANGFPALSSLYVRDANFLELLTLAPPAPSFLQELRTATATATEGMTQPLEVYVKGLNESEWVFNSVAPLDGSDRSSRFGRKSALLSSDCYSSMAPHWGGEARRSVIVGNGFGGFLKLPSEEEVVRPATATTAIATGTTGTPTATTTFSGTHVRKGSSTRSRHDLWR